MLTFKEKCDLLESKGLTYFEIADVLDSEYNIVRMVIEDEPD